VSERARTLNERIGTTVDPEKTDWGYCIPDCGKCCLGKGKELTRDETGLISSGLGIRPDDFIGIDEEKTPGGPSEYNARPGAANRGTAGYDGTGCTTAPRRKRLFLKTKNDRCVFAGHHSLCQIYDLKPSVCSKYGNWISDCRDYRKIRRLSEDGSDITKRLKRLWLAELKKDDYNRVKWKVKAELLVERLAARKKMKDTKS
jgi:Fe-S-cluster containining protein